MDEILRSAINRFKTKIATDSGMADKSCKRIDNNLLPILQRHWEEHCNFPKYVILTVFSVKGGCQLVSNHRNQLLLNVALNQPEDYEKLCRFRKLDCYNLFHNDGNIFELEFGGLTTTALQITSELLAKVFDVPLDEEIKILEFLKYMPPN